MLRSHVVNNIYLNMFARRKYLMILHKCRLGKNILSDGTRPCKPEALADARTGYAALASGAKITPLQPETCEQRGIRGFVRRLMR